MAPVVFDASKEAAFFVLQSAFGTLRSPFADSATERWGTRSGGLGTLVVPDFVPKACPNEVARTVFRCLVVARKGTSDDIYQSPDQPSRQH